MMSVAQGVQHARHGVVGLPVIMHRDAGHVVPDEPAPVADPIHGQQGRGGDMQPACLPANAKAGLVQVLDLGASHLIAHALHEARQPICTIAAHLGNRRRNEAHAEQVAHHLGHAIFRHELAVQQIHHNGADPRAVLHRSRYAGRKRRLGSLAACRTTTLMGAMLGHDHRTWLGQVEDLPRCVSARHGGCQPHPTSGAGLRIVVLHHVGRLGLTQRVARMSLSPPGRVAGRLAQAPHPHRLLEPVARRRLAAVGAIQSKATLQLGDPRPQGRYLLGLRRDLRGLRRNQRKELIPRRFDRRVPILSNP